MEALAIITLENLKLSETYLYKEQGDRTLEIGDFVSAIEFYSQGLKVCPENPEVLANRALAYNNIGCNELALKDAEQVLEINGSHAKCIVQKVKSLWGLKKVGEALRFLNGKVPSYALSESDLLGLINNSQKILKQMLKGEYEMEEIMKSTDDKLQDIAEFTGPVKIAQVPGKGRGLLATENINQGQLIICSKAYAIIFGDKTKAVSPISETIAAKLIWDPKSRKDFCNLYAGSKSTKEQNWLYDQCNNEQPSKLFVGNNNVTTWSQKKEEIMEEIENRVFINAFNGRKGSNIGVWVLPSYINHSCVDVNSFWLPHGDFMFIRAVKPIKAGEEIIMCYNSSRKQLFSSMKFQCNCRLCQLDESESPEIRQMIHETMESIENNLETMKFNESILKEQFARVEKLISLRAEHPGTSVFLFEECIKEVISQSIIKSKWKFCAKVFLETWKASRYMGVANTAVSMSFMLLNCHKEMWNITQYFNWRKQLKLDLITEFGPEVEKWDDNKIATVIDEVVLVCWEPRL